MSSLTLNIGRMRTSLFQHLLQITVEALCFNCCVWVYRAGLEDEDICWTDSVTHQLLKREFELLKLCQSNQISHKTSFPKVVDKVIINKCKFFYFTFQTEAGLKVYMDLEHQNKSGGEETINCKHCTVKCSDNEVLKKHISREHNK